MKHLSNTAINIALAGAITLASCEGSGDSPTARPNVVLIVVDTLRADVIEDFEGLVNTPRIDELTNEGVAFSRAYSHAPMTLPSHTALFSSRLPVESGVLNNSQSVPDDLPLLSEWLSKYGYSTRAVISLGTLTPPKNNEGLRRGFEKYDAHFFNLDKAEDVFPRLQANFESWPAFKGEDQRPYFLFAHYCDPHEPYRSYADTTSGDAVIRIDGRELGRYALQDAPNLKLDVDLEAGTHQLEIDVDGDALLLLKALQVSTDKGERSEITYDEGAKFEQSRKIRAHFQNEESGQFSLRVWMHDVLNQKEMRRRYIAEVEHVDSFVGDLLDLLRDSGTYDNTLVIFVSDHGEALGERGVIGHVQNLSDPMIHVPLIIKPPVRGEMGKQIQGKANEPVALMDLTPTILSACGLPPLPGQRGESLLSSQRQRQFEHIAETHKPEARQDRVSLFDGTLRMVFVADEDRFYLYDLKQDPHEEHDVFKERGKERPEWPQRLRTISEQAQAITAGESDVGSDRADALRALGYGG